MTTATPAETRAAVKLAKSLDQSCSSMNAYIRACQEAGHELKGADDGRLLLIRSMSEYAGWLHSKYATYKP